MSILNSHGAWASAILGPDSPGAKLVPIPQFVALFGSIFLITYSSSARWGLTQHNRGITAACSASLCHGLLTFTMASWQLVSSWPFSVDQRNNAAQEATLQLSTGYMISDFCFFLMPFTPDDYLFIGHHFMTSLYMVQALLLGRGALSALVLMAAGEATSALQNSWYIARVLRGRSPVAERAFKAISPVYTYVFLVVRSVIGPPLTVWLACALCSAKSGAIPPGYRYTWAVFGVLGTVGSQIWSYKLWRGLQKHRRLQQKQA